MLVLISGGTGHVGSYVIADLIAAGPEVVALARSDASAAAASSLGAILHRGDVADLDGLEAGAVESNGVIHLGHRPDLLPSGGITALAESEVAIVHASCQALAGTDQPLVVAGSIATLVNVGRGVPLGVLVGRGRPAIKKDPALPSGPNDVGYLVARNSVERAIVNLAGQGVRSSAVRSATGACSWSRSQEQGVLPVIQQAARTGTPPCTCVALPFRTIWRLKKGDAGKTWHAIGEEGIPSRDIARAIATRLGISAMSIPAAELMLPGYFGMLAAVARPCTPLPGVQPVAVVIRPEKAHSSIHKEKTHEHYQHHRRRKDGLGGCRPHREGRAHRPDDQPRSQQSARAGRQTRPRSDHRNLWRRTGGPSGDSRRAVLRCGIGGDRFW